jgi:hypothetical protein
MKRLLVISLLAAACASQPNLPQRCTNAAGFSISYPAGWHTNSGAVIPACSTFDPQPIDIPRDSEIPFGIAVFIDVEQVEFEQLARSNDFETILSSERMTVAGRDAIRVEAESTGQGLADRGMRTFRYSIDLGGGRTLIASTHSASPDYESNKRVLAEMIETLELR